jgi:hypothetical protein
VKVSERLTIIDKIGRELQTRYRFDEIDIYLEAFGVSTPTEITVNSKWVYVKTALRNVPLQTIAKIAEDLGIGPLSKIAADANPPECWKDGTKFRLFISHIAKDKKLSVRLKDCLAQYGISGFVAHEDIRPTLAWQHEIEKALFAMEAMVAVHTKGFSASFWTQQEIGFALGRGIKVISLRMDEDPVGFVSKTQALSRGTRTAEQVSAEIVNLLQSDELTTKRMAEVSASDEDAEIPF